MVLQQRPKLSETVRDASHQAVHPAQVFVLIVIQQLLELRMEQLQMLLDQDSFAVFPPNYFVSKISKETEFHVNLGNHSVHK
ncbi:unnamed protein product [Acanthoscelides obtectus]|uniref:Uncharacterized protein n=1 Tax=Acanthoscelides obtectus TaxID=200917 RepID=A0A9P0M0P6_ACAOB|nr:unnamed protein product [Acanthoscelides obtectus]CAK1658616.1 hypothetical protein AOBTE_LOCUS21026 [Acanthoscelides obtectus]